MDRELELFLLSTIASTFTTIGTALGRYLESKVDKRVQEEPKNVPVLSTEVRAEETIDNSVEKPEPKKAEADEPKAEAAITKAKKEAPKHKTTIVEVRKIMTELSRKGKGKVIQDVLSNDFNVTKLSDVKEDDYDDFVTRVLYYAGETNEFVEVDNA